MALAAALALLAGCARDLDLPPQATGPRLLALVPAQAYAGELVEIRGAGFADEPTANRVGFSRATTQGLARTAEGLLVRVPADAGSGPVTVTTSRGASEPLAGFEYRGLGQLRAGQVVQAVPLLHRPRALFAPGPEPVLDSDLFGGLVDTGAAPTATPHGFQRPVAGGDSIYLVDEAGRLVRHRPGAGEVAAAALATTPSYLGHVADPAGPLVVAVDVDAAGDRLSVFDGDTLAPRPGPWPLGLKVQSELVDAGDGRLALLAEDGAGAVTLALVDPRVAPPAVILLPTPPAELQASPSVVAAGDTAAGPVVAVALARGQVGLATLSPAPAWAPQPVDTFSATAISALLVAGGRVVAAKADDGLVLGIDPVAGAVAWALEAARPTALAQGPTGAAWVAGEADNVLVALRPASGALLGRRGADPGVTAAGLHGGAAFRPEAQGGAAVAFPVARPPALVTWPLGGDPEAAPQAVAPGLVAWDPWAQGFWIGGPDATALGGGAPVAVPGGLEALVPSPAGLVTLGGALALVRGGVVLPLAADLDTSLVPPARSLDGRLLLVGSLGGAERARLWGAAALAAAGPPDLDVEVPGFALQGAFIDGAPWACWLDADTFEPRSARLAADGRLVDGVPGLIPDGVISPNGRTVVVPEPGLLGAGLTALRVVALEPAAGFPTVDRIELPAPVVGLAFDDAGERLLVVTRAPDQLLVLE